MSISYSNQKTFQYRGVSVLYVEDEAETRQKLVRVLQRRFPYVHVAEDSKDGYKLYQKVEPDLVITDIKMNRAGGLQLIEKIRAENSKVQIIVTTAHDENEYFIHSIENNVNHFILKPIDLGCFLLAIQKSVFQIKLEKELDEKKRLTRTVMDFQDNLIFVLDNKKIVECNQAFSSFTGISNNRPLPDGLSLSSLFCEDPNYFYPSPDGNWISDFLALGKTFVKVRLKSREGREPIYIMKSTAIPGENKLLFICTDITELETESRKNQVLAMIDPLTRIFNRDKFDEILSAEMRRAERYGHPFSIIMFDVDDFKKVNDHFGHECGDQILVTLATMVQQRIRECDILARWGGDEFILIAPETDEKDAFLLANLINELVGSFDFKEASQITCSFGVTEFKEGKTKASLLKEADQALYHSKHMGRNCVTANSKIQFAN